MATTMKKSGSSRINLDAELAADLMCGNPISIHEGATVQEAITLLTEHGFSAAPVIDSTGRAVGVLSRSDLIAHDREKNEYLSPHPQFKYDAESLASHMGSGTKGYQIVNVDRTRVREIMTPAVFSVTPETPALTVIKEMLALAVHRLFVVDETGVLVGVISSTDVLRRLK